MIVYGYAKDYMYANDGRLLIQVRIPAIHGPYSQANYNGALVHNYTSDADLPYYPSVILPRLPADGDVVAMTSIAENKSEFLVIGLTGGCYQP